MSVAQHYDAVVARLNNGILAGKVDEVVRMTTGSTPEYVRANYVVVNMPMPDLRDHRFTGPQSADDFAVYDVDVRSVAVDRGGCMLFAQTVRERLLRHVLPVPGRVCTPIRLVPPVEEGQVQYDRTARLFYIDESFRFTSNPA